MAMNKKGLSVVCAIVTFGIGFFIVVLLTAGMHPDKAYNASLYVIVFSILYLAGVICFFGIKIIQSIRELSEKLSPDDSETDEDEGE
jgi:ABC-type thiamin/hydroxymethylpyrimidine transport system permease subunit